MDESRRNLMVGVFVLLGLTALGALVILFGQVPTAMMQGDTYLVTIRFDSVAGIREGTLATVRGKQIGRVRRVEFANPGDLTAGVNVVVAVEQAYQIPQDSRASTMEAGLIAGGRPPIEFHLGDSPVMLAANSPPISGETVGAISAILPPDIYENFTRTAGELGDAAAALKPVLADLRHMLKPQTPADVDLPGGPQGNLSSTAARLDTALKNINALVSDPDRLASVDAVIANVQAMSVDGRQLMTELRGTAQDVKAAVSRADGVVAQTGQSIERLDGRVEDVARVLIDDLNQAGNVLKNLDKASAMAANGEGTVGKLLRDDRLYESLVLTSRRLADTIEEMRLLVLQWQKGKIRIGF